MFTGIIEHTGTIISSKSLGEGVELWINSKCFGDDIQLGESISLNGVCTTVCQHQDFKICVQLLKETLEKSTFSSLKPENIVNVERSLTLEKRLGGHWITGHVDGKGKIESIVQHDIWTVIQIKYPQEFAHLLVEKGSITIDGISLTVVSLGMSNFRVHIIPHTISNTNLKTLKEGDNVNLEFDIVGKYIHRYQEVSQYAK